MASQNTQSEQNDESNPVTNIQAELPPHPPQPEPQELATEDRDEPLVRFVDEDDQLTTDEAKVPHIDGSHARTLLLVPDRREAVAEVTG